MNSGYNSTVLGLPGMDHLAEEMMLWRDIQLVRKTGVKYHAQHISTAGSVNLIKQAKADGLAQAPTGTIGELVQRCKRRTDVLRHSRTRRTEPDRTAKWDQFLPVSFPLAQVAISAR